MFTTAKSIIDELNGRNEVKFDIDEEMGCDDTINKLVITGHSLGAGVASVLALLLHESKDYREKIVCYAYSPPGCVFRLSYTYYYSQATNILYIASFLQFSLSSVFSKLHYIGCSGK